MCVGHVHSTGQDVVEHAVDGKWTFTRPWTGQKRRYRTLQCSGLIGLQQIGLQIGSLQRGSETLADDAKRERML